VSRILISSVLAVVLSGGSPASTGLSAWPAHPLPAGLAAQARPEAGRLIRQQFGWPLAGSRPLFGPFTARRSSTGQVIAVSTWPRWPVRPYSLPALARLSSLEWWPATVWCR
jgi:hypothetical protein